jgi:hypothetical protein
LAVYSGEKWAVQWVVSKAKTRVGRSAAEWGCLSAGLRADALVEPTADSSADDLAEPRAAWWVYLRVGCLARKKADRSAGAMAERTGGQKAGWWAEQTVSQWEHTLESV